VRKRLYRTCAETDKTLGEKNGIPVVGKLSETGKKKKKPRGRSSQDTERKVQGTHNGKRGKQSNSGKKL